MNNQVYYYPNDTECKLPTGGAAVNEPVRFTLLFSRPSNPGEVYLSLTKEGESEVLYPMSCTGEHEGTYRYAVELPVTSRGLYFYHFRIDTDDDKQVRIGSDDDLSALYGKGGDWQLTVYEPSDGPDWIEGGIVYQILPDRFNVGGERHKTKPYAVYRDDWGGLPEYRPTPEGKTLNIDFFGGNLKGITKKLAYLKSLGVTCLYLNPIFEAHSNHKYDTGNYRRVDPDFGTADDLKELIVKAGKKGIRILLDGVFSHTGDDSIYFNRYGTYDSVGAYQSENSVYRPWYTFGKTADDYKCWWNILILPEVNENDPTYSEYICGEDGILRYWTRMGLGGWRLDVADELPDAFLDRAAAAVRKVCPDAMMLGEVWEDASNKSAYGVRRRYLQGGQLDSVTNYPFKEDILRFAATGDAGRLRNTVEHIINNYPKRTLDRLVNILGTHDTVRVLTALGDNGDVSGRDERAVARITDRPAAIRRLKLATVLQYMLPGVPCVYYGDEAGMEGFEDPFNRRCYPWNEADREVLRHYRKLGRIRTAEKAILSRGVYRNLTAADGVFAFTRTSGAGTLTVIANAGSAPYAFAADTAYIDLLTGRPFKGKVAPGEAVILKPADV